MSLPSRARSAIPGAEVPGERELARRSRHLPPARRAAPSAPPESTAGASPPQRVAARRSAPPSREACWLLDSLRQGRRKRWHSRPLPDPSAHDCHRQLLRRRCRLQGGRWLATALRQRSGSTFRHPNELGLALRHLDDLRPARFRGGDILGARALRPNPGDDPRDAAGPAPGQRGARMLPLPALGVGLRSARVATRNRARRKRPRDRPAEISRGGDGGAGRDGSGTAAPNARPLRQATTRPFDPAHRSLDRTRVFPGSSADAPVRGRLNVAGVVLSPNRRPESHPTRDSALRHEPGALRRARTEPCPCR
jgi:hypothetical protein